MGKAEWTENKETKLCSSINNKYYYIVVLVPDTGFNSEMEMGVVFTLGCHWPFLDGHFFIRRKRAHQ